MKSIKGKLLAGMVLLSFGICLMMTALNSVMLYNTSKAGMDTSVKSSVAAYSAAIENAIGTYKSAAENMARDDRITPTASVMQLKAIRNDLKQKYNFSDVVFVDSNGSCFDNRSVNLSDRDYFKSAMSGTACISSPMKKESDGSVVFYIAAKVNNDSNYNGVVIAELSNDVFSKIIKDAVIGANGYGFMIDKTGTVIAHKENSLVTSFTNYVTLAKKDSSYKSIGACVTNMMGKKAGTAEMNFKAAEKYIAYAPVKNSDSWVLAIVADENEMMASFRNSIVLSLAVALLFIIVSCIIATLFATSIAKPISLVCRRLELLSDGDLDSDIIEIRKKDETGILASSLNKTVTSLRGYIADLSGNLSKMAQGDLRITKSAEYKGNFIELEKSMIDIATSLNDVLFQIHQASEQVAGSSGQVSNGAQALAQGATEQASSIQELSATIAEISSNIKTNAEHAATASMNAHRVRSEIDASSRHMNDMVESMTLISESSSQIGKIIKAIEDIAFQTNILALNAAVEAARAGASGKGFSVVADEVRNLAGKSAKAAKSITFLIENSITQVENGTRIADETAKSLFKVVESAKAVSDTVEHITIASKYQADAISQIMAEVDHVSSIVQINSAAAEESAAASEELSGQARAMETLVGKFKLNKTAEEQSNGG